MCDFADFTNSAKSNAACDIYAMPVKSTRSPGGRGGIYRKEKASSSEGARVLSIQQQPSGVGVWGLPASRVQKRWQDGCHPPYPLTPIGCRICLLCGPTPYRITWHAALNQSVARGRDGIHLAHSPWSRQSLLPYPARLLLHIKDYLLPQRSQHFLFHKFPFSPHHSFSGFHRLSQISQAVLDFAESMKYTKSQIW